MYMYMENDILNELAQRKQHTAQRVEPHKLTNIKKSTMTYSMFCPGYLEWWLDANLHLVLFIIIYILNSVSVAYAYMYMYLLNVGLYSITELWLIHNKRWLIHAEWRLFLTSVGPVWAEHFL